jgi:hypothetical protein
MCGRMVPMRPMEERFKAVIRLWRKPQVIPIQLQTEVLVDPSCLLKHCEGHKKFESSRQEEHIDR